MVGPYTASEREMLFWCRVDRSGGPEACWPWTRYRTPLGYGLFRDGRTGMRGAHRYAFRVTYGEIPAGLLVLHSCDNPPCCNPAHLSLGTNDDNMADMKRKRRGRTGERKGSANPGAKLSDAAVLEIRRRFAAGGSSMRSDLAREYGVSPSSIWNVVTFRTWAHIHNTRAAALPAADGG